VQIMDVMEEKRAEIGRPKVWDDFIAAVKRHVPEGESCVGFIDRFSFYDKAKTSFVTISTGERQPYGCVLLQKGVM